MTEHILIVEDELEVARSLANFLSKDGYQVSHLSKGDQVMPFLSNTDVDLILLDIMLPGLNGYEICQQVRRSSQTPIFMLTACSEECEKLRGLELGADDYIEKPFSAPELLLRIRNFLKRFGRCTNGFVVDSTQYCAQYNGQPLDLTKAEFELVALLQRYPNQAFSREQILNNIYDDYRDVSDRTVDTHIKNLRKKLKQVSPEHEYIQAVYGVGYRFVGESARGLN